MRRELIKRCERIKLLQDNVGILKEMVAIMISIPMVKIQKLYFKEEGKDIVLPDTVDFKLPKGAILLYVDIDMASYRKKIRQQNGEEELYYSCMT